MKSFDAFGRPVQEFQVKTTCGGYLSLCSLCLVTLLFLTELRYFIQLEMKDEMVIDQNQDQKSLNITLDVTLRAAPCAVLSMNLLDPKRANIMHVGTEIYKTRLSQDGKALGKKVRDSLVNVAMSSSELLAAGGATSGVRTSHATGHLRCNSCFGAHTDEDDCCSSCEDVRQEFRKKGWNEPSEDYIFGQCAEEAYDQVPPEDGEGCRIEATLQVRKVPATLHIGVPRHFRPSFLKQQDWSGFAASLDFSHEISGLTFGPDFPGLVPVLDGRKKDQHVAPNSEHYQYDIHVIPTRYLEDGLDEVSSHQYSVTEYVKSLDHTREQNEETVASGLWMSYDFTPFEVRVTKSRKSMWHFLTECCAILGGIFAFTGMIDNFAYQFNKAAGTRGRGNGGTQLVSMDSRG